MSANVRAALFTMVASGVPLATSAIPAAARTTGTASFRGQIVAPAQSGSRKVVSSMIAFNGVFDGVGTIVEIPNRPKIPTTSAATTSCSPTAPCTSSAQASSPKSR